MELGGSDPYIVLEDANLEKAIDWAVWSRLLNCGQGCVSAKRFIVVEPLYDRFLAGVLGRLERIRVGNPMEESTDIGPLSSQAARSLLLNQVERAVCAGAKLVTGGRAIDRDGFYFEPAILTEIRKGNPAYAEEVFGPVFLMFRSRMKRRLCG
jgi:succinate-semialdehyde dehydrogenase/glutarate-semialdehyde dehydrogenase